ncbi:MAG: ATP synthase subunit C [Clostridiales bacterium]|jgi:V/A-type H+-transporting ATPase subunit K|nr:ATP synthase subunit C [Clostridiales bacterium]MDR2750113.1 ATP synthase subunit C [Clostridiales bacterium]
MAVKVLIALLALSIVVPMAFYWFGERKPRSFKTVLAANIISFFGVLVFATVFMLSGNAYAAEEVAATASSDAGMAYLAAALVTGLCTIGTGIATGQAASAALGALSENEKIMGKALIFVSLCEGIAIYGLLISFTILGRV